MLPLFFTVIKICYLFVTTITYFASGESPRNATLTDISKCKLTQLGTEYIGSVMTTAGGIRCQSWFSKTDLDEDDPIIIARNFPERSVINAKNYCRNPNKNPRGPWCYTTDPMLTDDECAIPLCNYGECRISGIGAEYGGTNKISSSGKKCKSWDKRHKLATEKTPKFERYRFSDGSRTKAGHFCRNPDNSLGGPWCYIEEENLEWVRKEYCDIPFCDDRDCLAYARNASAYSTITELNSTLGNITFWIKLWDPSDEREAVAKILLSLLPVPTSAEKIAQEWRAGVEIRISNFGSGQTFPQTDNEQDFEDSPNILLGSKWTGIWIAWGDGFISVGIVDSSRPIFLDEYKNKNSISSLYPDKFLYYGIMGTGILWSTDFCLDDCEVHTTFGNEFLRVWPLQQTNGTNDLVFYVRSSHSIAVRLYQTPATSFPCVTLTIGDANTMSLTFQESEKSLKQYLKTAPSEGLLDFWTWKEFTLSIFGSHLRLFLKTIYGKEEMLYLSYNFFSILRWFSIGSEQTIAHWMLFCTADEIHPVEDPSLPNCISSLTEYGYQGNQWISTKGVPCIPWISNEIPPVEKKDDHFTDGSVIEALNRCRNPLKDPQGPYCYSMSHDLIPLISKDQCHIRTCKSSECRAAGTANDYIGALSVTRSGRKCVRWSKGMKSNISAIANGTAFTNTRSNVTMPIPNTLTINDMITDTEAAEDTFIKSLVKQSFDFIHPVDPAYHNDSLYPENSVKDAKNYCRDPSRNIAGTWCYTTDPQVPQDLCDVRDCDKPESCIFLVRGQGFGRRLYILPEHRSEGLHFSAKAWEPDRPDTITFEFSADDGLNSKYLLKIGTANNEQVILYYQSEEEGLKMVKKRTLSHLLYLGKWSSFVIRIPRGKVQLYYEGAQNPLFEWQHPNPAKSFLPIYYNYTSELGNGIGIAFDCNSRCHIENTKTDRITKILPLSVWSLKSIRKPDKVQLMIRAEGVVLIPLLLLPATPGYYGLKLGESGKWIYFIKDVYPNIRIFHKKRYPWSIFSNNTWTNITIKWFHKSISVFRNETQVFHYEHSSPLVFYYFSLIVDSGSWATWTANCLPSDIDGDPQDGGWSEWGPWECSASCNGGIGRRTRFCNNPEPNVRGEPCLGPSSMTGRCNTIICGDIIEDTENLIKRRIRQNHTSLIVKEGDSVTISSDTDVVNRTATESPDADMRWSLNGIFVEEEKNRISLRNHNIIISKAELVDSGIYIIALHRVDETDMITKIVSLAVKPNKESVLIRETLQMSVTCNCVTLGYAYSDLNVVWKIGDNVWKDYGTTVPLSVNVDYVPAVNKSHHGLWKCIVKQDDLGFQWTTNIISVKVIRAPNWKTHLMEDKLTRPIFGWMPSERFVATSALVIFILLTGCIILVATWFIRFRDSLKLKIFGIIKFDENNKEEKIISNKKKESTSGTDEESQTEETANTNDETEDVDVDEKQQLLQ